MIARFTLLFFFYEKYYINKDILLKQWNVDTSKYFTVFRTLYVCFSKNSDTYHIR